MLKKVRKTLYLPDFVVAYLDAEGYIYDGPGTIAAAAIFDFFRKSDEEKKAALKQFSDCSIELAYAYDVEADGPEVLEAARKVVHRAARKAQNKSLRTKKAGRTPKAG